MSAQQLEAPVRRTAQDEEFATFVVGDMLLGVDICQVREINRLTDCTPVPQAPSYVAGVVNLRGEVVTVVDLRAVLGVPPPDHKQERRNVVVQWRGENVGLLVDRIADVVTSSTDQLAPPPANLGAAQRRFYRGVIQLKHELLLIIDVNAILDGEGHKD